MNTPALDRISARLCERLAVGGNTAAYRVPGLWLDPYGPQDPQVVVPEQFFLDRIGTILAELPRPLVTGHDGPGDWGRYAVAYNLFVRSAAAWDHDGDGQIAVGPNPDGWRETGTFLKAITLLPFIRSLGCNVVHLLPVTAIGRDGNKGNLGSPFAIRDPYALDEGQSEPALGLGAEVEFAAFVEASHHLGLRVVVEFVFRTAAKDAAWVGEHPEWFYWIRADVPDQRPGELAETAYGAPLFMPEELEGIYRLAGTGRYVDTIPPHEPFRRMFTVAPQPEDVRLVGGRWLGTVHDAETGQPIAVRIPGAFADWTPDSDQPPWSDVTYLRMYDDPGFNYIAYNTVRMVDDRLARPENIVRGLWDKISAVIPYWQETFGIDGVMIDMGHALPPALKQRMVSRARGVDPDFALWAEDFDLKPGSRAEGYNVCVGPFMQTVRDRRNLVRWLRELGRTGVVVPFMAMAENHNVPRAVTWPGGLAYALYAQAIGAFLPGVPYIHGGIELAETRPINTGFDFTQAQVAGLPAPALHLFSAGAYDWTRRPNLVASLRRLHAARAPYAELITDPGPESVQPVETDNPLIVAFRRGRPGGPGLLVLANSDRVAPQSVSGPVIPVGGRITDPTTGKELDAGVGGTLVLAPCQVVICRL